MSADLKLNLGRAWSEDYDCFECVRDFYIDNYGLEMNDHARPANWWTKNPELDLLRSNFLAEGWEAMPNIQRRQLALGDGLLMAIGGKVISHCAVYISNNWFYHNPFRGVVQKDLWAGYYADKTLIVIRHPQVYRPQARGSVALIDLLSPEKQEKYRAASNGLIP